jgi:Ion channel
VHTFLLRNLIEFAAILLIWAAMLYVIPMMPGPAVATALVLLVALAKTTFFGLENLRQLYEASQRNTAYHRFMLIMLVNMSQIILSFALDDHCLFQINPAAFSMPEQELTPAGTVFEFVYYSTLNFTFFGYGDMTPQTIPAKFLTMTEILLAFITVIFLLSDFISLKESLRPPGPPGGSTET